MSECCSRRQALLRLASLSGVAAATGNALAAAAAATTKAATASTRPATKPAAPATAAKPHVSPTEPTAVALAYHEDIATVDAKLFPTFKKGQQCSNCLQATGLPRDAWWACSLFPGKVVAANGWCKVYIKRP